MLIHTSATDNNRCSSVLPNNSSGHYKKASAVAFQILIGNLRCVSFKKIDIAYSSFVCLLSSGFVATFAYTSG